LVHGLKRLSHLPGAQKIGLVVSQRVGFAQVRFANGPQVGHTPLSEDAPRKANAGTDSFDSSLRIAGLPILAAVEHFVANP
jgi:hypothetical protein